MPVTMLLRAVVKSGGNILVVVDQMPPNEPNSSPRPRLIDQAAYSTRTAKNTPYNVFERRSPFQGGRTVSRSNESTPTSVRGRNRWASLAPRLARGAARPTMVRSPPRRVDRTTAEMSSITVMNTNTTIATPSALSYSSDRSVRWNRKPMPPAPTKPSTVDDRRLMSRR
jgi:hypothetical protein